jgi:hypothetical protein
MEAGVEQKEPPEAVSLVEGGRAVMEAPHNLPKRCGCGIIM